MPRPLNNLDIDGHTYWIFRNGLEEGFYRIVDSDDELKGFTRRVTSGRRGGRIWDAIGKDEQTISRFHLTRADAVRAVVLYPGEDPSD